MRWQEVLLTRAGREGRSSLRVEQVVREAAFRGLAPSHVKFDIARWWGLWHEELVLHVVFDRVRRRQPTGCLYNVRVMANPRRLHTSVVKSGVALSQCGACQHHGWWNILAQQRGHFQV